MGIPVETWDTFFATTFPFFYFLYMYAQMMFVKKKKKHAQMITLRIKRKKRLILNQKFIDPNKIKLDLVIKKRD